MARLDRHWRAANHPTIGRLRLALRHVGGSKRACRTALEPLLPIPDRFSGIIPPPCTRAAVDHYVRNEWAVHLSDVLVRRSSWHYYNVETGAQAEQVATWMAEIAGWSADRRAHEVAAYHAETGAQPAHSTAA